MKQGAVAARHMRHAHLSSDMKAYHGRSVSNRLLFDLGRHIAGESILCLVEKVLLKGMWEFSPLTIVVRIIGWESLSLIKYFFSVCTSSCCSAWACGEEHWKICSQFSYNRLHLLQRLSFLLDLIDSSLLVAQSSCAIFVNARFCSLEPRIIAVAM